MVRGLSLSPFFLFFLFFFFCNHPFIVLGTKSLMQHELWREQNLYIQTNNK